MPISITSPLLESAGFSHGFSTRHVDLQLGAEGYRAALDRFAGEVRIDPFTLRQVRQVHGKRVLDAARLRDGESRACRDLGPEEADALIAFAPYAVGIRVADCVPILVADTRAGTVAAIHAGWRGAVDGVIASTFHALRAAASNGPFVAAIGPCIGACCFEVEESVGRTLIEATGESVVWRREGGKTWVDLRMAVRFLLMREGLDAVSVEDVAGCTRCEKGLFFSYRREGMASGRHLAIIAARPPEATFPAGGRAS